MSEQSPYRSVPLGTVMADRSAGQLRFGTFILDRARGELLHEDQRVPLRRQAFDTLCRLVERSGHTVSKDELVGAVWTSPPADPDGSIAQCIREIRQALGTDSRWMIQTVTGAGYKFKGEVLTLPPERAGRQTENEAANSRRGWLMHWIARRPGLAVTVALASGAVLTGSLVLAWFIVSSMSQRGPNVSAFVPTCTLGKSACIRTGGDEQTCEGRRQSCLATGCWNGGLVQRCGYEKK